jgi:hypothetical protein
MIHTIVIGDWSSDGHEKSDQFTFECNAEEADIKKAYLQAVKRSGISLHRDKDATSICCEYEDNRLNEDVIEKLKEIGVDFTEIHLEDEDGGTIVPEDVARLFFGMVKTQIPGFEYKLIENPKTINGFWSKDFNHSFGYGCYN